MKKLVTIILVLQSLGLTAQTTNRTMDSLIEKTITEYKIPSMVVGYITGDTCYYGSAGTTKVNGDQEVTLNDKYHLASNTKAITSLIAMRLVEEGKISMETTFIEIFPNLKKEISEEYYKITLGDLLSHNAGVQPYTNVLESLKLPEIKGTPSERRKAFAIFVLNEKPVSAGEYSNAGYAISSLMLEQASGMSFEELVAKTMKSLDFDHVVNFPNKADENAPWGHITKGNTQEALPPEYEYELEDYMLAAGDISMNVVDYSKLIQMHLNGLNGIDSYVSSAGFKQMHFGIDNYAYGWGNFENNGNKISAHDGSTGTFHSHAMLDPKSDFAIVIVMNAANQEQVKGLYEVQKEIIKNMR